MDKGQAAKVKRFASEVAAGRGLTGTWANEYDRQMKAAQDAGTLSGLSADAAVAEVERILSETEAGEDTESVTGGARVLATASREDGFKGALNSYRTALAASLAAVLPVLDEMAERSTDGYMPNGRAHSMYLRNRATLAAMGGR